MKPFITIILSLLAIAVSAQEQSSAELFDKLDEVLLNADKYIQHKEQKLNTLKEFYQQTKDVSEKYNYSSLVAEEYKTYNNDSALYYLNLCLGIAKQMQRVDWQNDIYIRLINQYNVSGYYDDASHMVNKVDTTALHPEQWNRFMHYRVNLANEQAFYSKDDSIAKSYWALAGRYSTELLVKLDKQSPLYNQMMLSLLLGNKEYKEAKKYSDLWLSSVDQNDPKYATMAYYRAEVYGHLGDVENQKIWFIKSAIRDIETATMDQASLWSLANIINKEGQTKKSYEYIKYSWDCISRFSIHMRGWQVMPVMQGIEANYKQMAERDSRLMKLGFFSAIILLLLLLGSHFYIRKKNRLLSESRNEMDELNSQLSRMNEELSVSNSLLEDTNKVKEKYIGVFINLCSQYIEKLDTFRIKVNRKLRAGQINEIIALTDSEKLKNKELDELHQQFDKTFLALFPTFIDDFNQLLTEDARIVIKEKGRLNTNLRIFALIRLGIDDSASIASFLHYTPNSIYCYRARLKNKALGNRDEFEQQVKALGII